MAIPWTEAGAAMLLSGVLVLMGNAPVPVVTPADVEAYEGRTVRITGFVDDIDEGVDGHRGVLHADGHGVRFDAEGMDPPPEDAWVELRGTLHRERGYLVLHVEPSPWTW